MDPVALSSPEIISMFASSVSTGMQVGGELREGKAIKASKDFEAAQLDRQATARYAEGTRSAYEDKRASDIVQSNARAAMAASGGTTTDEGATEQLAGIESRGKYNVLASLFDAEVDAQSLKLRADASRYEGKLAKHESKRRALSTVISGAANRWGGFDIPETKAKKESKVYKKNLKTNRSYGWNSGVG